MGIEYVEFLGNSNFEINRVQLASLMEVYENKGKVSEQIGDLKKVKKTLFHNRIVGDSLFIVQFITNKVISEFRAKQLITNKAKPNNNSEIIFLNAYKAFNGIEKGKIRINNSFLFDFINRILFGVDSVEYTTVEVNKQKSHTLKSKRLLFEEVLTELTEKLGEKEYENVWLLYDFYNVVLTLNPYDKYNELLAHLAILFKLIETGHEYFMYISYFESMYRISAGFINMNYDFLIRTVNSALESWQKTHKLYINEQDNSKLQNVIETIGSLPSIFSKDDIRAKHPFVSDTTINRALKSMREDKKIYPFTKGRNSKWRKGRESRYQLY